MACGHGAASRAAVADVQPLDACPLAGSFGSAVAGSFLVGTSSGASSRTGSSLGASLGGLRKAGEASFRAGTEGLGSVLGTSSQGEVAVVDSMAGSQPEDKKARGLCLESSARWPERGLAELVWSYPIEVQCAEGLEADLVGSAQQ